MFSVKLKSRVSFAVTWLSLRFDVKIFCLEVLWPGHPRHFTSRSAK